MTMKPLLKALVAASLGLFGAAALAQAESFPGKKPISLVVGYAAGGSVDLVARTVAPELAKRLGQQVIVENAAGAGGTLAALKVVSAPADGHTLLLGSTSEVGINALTAKKPRYNAVNDLAPVGMIGNQPLVLVTTPRTPLANAAAFKDFVAARPGKLSYASSGIGTPLHLAGELIKRDGQLFILHIPYRGAAPMVTDLLGGQVDFAVFVLSSALPHIQDGRMQAIGVTTAKRSPAAPNIPALAETKAFAGVDIGVWFGLFAPAKTPAPIQAQLQKELREVLRQPDVVSKLQTAGLTLTPDLDGRKFVRSEIDRFAKIVEFAKIETD